MATAWVAADEIRARFSRAMSEMYQVEVPLYGELLEIVADVNETASVEPKTPHGHLPSDDDRRRIQAERHGAIRVGTPAELSMIRRAFAVMGMFPVGYYDLSVAGQPIHSTAFRPIGRHPLAANPFRVFTSLLRLELVEDVELRECAAQILAKRSIFTPSAQSLVEKSEEQGGLDGLDAEFFVSELLDTFRWHGDAIVDAGTYDRLRTAHRLIADIVSFRGPHINHLTPRTLDIDAAQVEMQRRNIETKAVIEGPPPRSVPILLRQTSFKALEEEIHFTASAPCVGTHTARFGEIEQRGAALTPKGRQLYDALLYKAREENGTEPADYAQRLAETFAEFPDDLGTLRREGLAYFRFLPTKHALGREMVALEPCSLEALIEAHLVDAVPIVYEDFLPVSAAGIFQSNLGDDVHRAYATTDAQSAFEAALGASVSDPFELYAQEEATSLADLEELFAVSIHRHAAA